MEKLSDMLDAEMVTGVPITVRFHGQRYGLWEYFEALQEEGLMMVDEAEFLYAALAREQ
jgi:hypothetical protein